MYFAPTAHGFTGLLDWLFGTGIGTNIGASIIWTALAGAVAVLIWPPLRRALHRFIDRKLHGLHERVEALHDRHDEQHTLLTELHATVSELHQRLDDRST